MTAPIAILLSIISALLMSAPCAIAADPAPGDQKATPTIPSLLDAITPGMTDAKIKQILHKLRPGIEWTYRGSLQKERTVSRYSLGDGAYLLLEYKNVADRNGNLGDNDRVATIQVLHFDELKGHIPGDLFEVVRLIHLSPSVDGSTFDPTSLVRAVNGLYPLGKDKALKALHAYDALNEEDSDRRFRYDLDEQRIFLVLRLLFVRTDGEAQMPWMNIGATDPEVEPANKDWPLFPLVVQNDIPFCLSTGYSLGGQAEPPSRHMDYCEKNCSLRKSPLHPSASPIRAIESICSSKAWNRLFTKPNAGEYTQYLLRLQSLRASSDIHRKPIDMCAFSPGCVSAEEAKTAWGKYSGDNRMINARWDVERQQFVAVNASSTKN